jgi:hypothetical protein
MLKQLMQAAISLNGGVRSTRYLSPVQQGYHFHWSQLWSLFGKTHTHWEDAARDFRSMMAYQQPGGLIPNFVVSKGSGLSADLLAPPLPAILLYHLYEFAPDKRQAMALVQALYPSVLAFHQHIYTYRDPLEEGLPFIWHPAESGFLALELLDGSTDAASWNSLLEAGGQLDVASGEMFRHHQFLVQDPMFLSLLTWANECLIKLGGLIRKDIEEVLYWHELTTYSINQKLWQAETKQYIAYNLSGEQRIELGSIRAFMPLVGEIPTQEQAELLLRRMESTDMGGQLQDNYLFPSRGMGVRGSDVLLEGKSIVQLDFNWMIIKGLLRYDFDEMAAKMERDSLDLVWHTGFWDGYDPLRYESGPRGWGYQYSPKTASLLIDLLIRKKGWAIFQ